MVSLQERPHGNSRGILSKMAVQNSLKGYLLAKLGEEASGFKTYEIALSRGWKKTIFATPIALYITLISPIGVISIFSPPFNFFTGSELLFLPSMYSCRNGNIWNIDLIGNIRPEYSLFHIDIG